MSIDTQKPLSKLLSGAAFSQLKSSKNECAARKIYGSKIWPKVGFAFGEFHQPSHFKGKFTP